MTAISRRRAALDAIELVRNGACPDDVETEIVDFKEEAGTVSKNGRQAIPTHHDPAAEQIANEVACMSNSDSGGVLVIGVNDKTSGSAAFVGTYLDTIWLRSRIFALTQPNLSVDVIEELVVENQRIYIINVPPGLQETWSGGKLRSRFGKECKELSGDRARVFLENRRNYDWSAQPSGWHFSAAHADALTSMRNHYSASHDRAPVGDLALATRLGLVVGEGGDPELNNAGALMLCQFEPTTDLLDIIVTDVEGTPSRSRLLEKAPLLTVFDRAWDLLEKEFPSRSLFVGPQRREVRALPDFAIREALVNALVHRDYRLQHSNIVVTLVGNPAKSMKILSPGGFPPDVSGDRLLSVPSRPRNPILAKAFWTLGLAEHEGIGIATMYRTMIRDGHEEPRIFEDSGDVICLLTGGAADAKVRGFFDGLAAKNKELGEDVRAHIAIYELVRSTPLRPEHLASAAQCSILEAREVMMQLQVVGILDRMANRSWSFELTEASRDQLSDRILYRTPKPIEKQWALIEAFLENNDEIGKQEAAQVLKVQPDRAASILSQFFNKYERLVPVKNARGRGVRYRLATVEH